MGSLCSTEEYDSINQEDINTHHKPQNTLVGLDKVDMYSFYDVGSGISQLSKSVYNGPTSVQHSKDSMAVANRYKNPFYTLSTVGHVCAADGRLHKKEAAFIKYHATTCGLSKKEIKEALKCKDYTTEMIESIGAIYDFNNKKQGYKKEKQAKLELKKQMSLRASSASSDVSDYSGGSPRSGSGKKKRRKPFEKPVDVEKERMVRGYKKYFILLALLAASQDGLVKDEYEQCTEIALDLGLEKQDVKDCIEIVRMELKMAGKLKKFLHPELVSDDEDDAKDDNNNFDP